MRSPIRERGAPIAHHHHHHHHHHSTSHHGAGGGGNGGQPKLKQKATQTDNYDNLFLSDEDDEDVNY
jgi:hypothetical protein